MCSAASQMRQKLTLWCSPKADFGPREGEALRACAIVALETFSHPTMRRPGGNRPCALDHVPHKRHATLTVGDAVRATAAP